jgi:hypothetical protein
MNSLRRTDVALLPSTAPQVVSLAPGADTSSSGSSYHNLPAGLPWQQYLAPITNDPVYFAQSGNTGYYVGRDNLVYQGPLSSFFFSDLQTPHGGQGPYGQTSADRATFVNPLPTAANVSWATVEQALGIPNTSNAPGAQALPATADPFATLTSALASLAAGGAPQAQLPVVPANNQPATVVPVQSGGGPNVGLVLVLFVLAAGIAWYWYKHRHGSAHHNEAGASHE